MNDGSIQIGVRRPMRSLSIAASGLTAQRRRMDVIMSNIANADTTRGVDGTPYRRKVIEMEEVAFQPVLDETTGETGATEYGGVRVAGVAEDTSDFISIYEPGHPDADEAGYVLKPNVSITTELVDMMDASAAFEANASVFEALKSALRKAAQL